MKFRHAIPATALMALLLNAGAKAQGISLGDAMDAPSLVWTASGSGPSWSSVAGSAAYDGADALICRMDSGEGTPAGPEFPQYLAGGVLETTVSGPAVASFRWRTDASSSGWLVFFIDGVAMGNAATTRTDSVWNKAVANLPAGPHTLRWQVIRSKTLSAGSIAAVTLDQLIVNAGAVWDVASALDDPGGIWATLGATEMIAEAASAAPPGGTGVSLIGEGSISYSTLTRLVEGPAIASWQWNGRPGTDGYVYSWVQEWPRSPARQGWEFSRAPQRDVWQSGRSAITPGRTALSFWYEEDELYSLVPIPVLYLDHFQINPATASEVLGLAGVSWTQSGAKPWRISADALGFGDSSVAGSLVISNAAPNESSRLTAQISGPAVLTWFGSVTGPDGDRITALLDGQPNETVLSPQGYAWAATYGLEIPSGVHEIAIVLQAGAGTLPAGQARGGAVGNVKLITPPANVAAWAAALGLPAGTMAYPDPRWQLTAQGASLPLTSLPAPLIIPVNGPGVVRVPIELPSGSQTHWTGISADQHLLALPPVNLWGGGAPTSVNVGSLTLSRGLLTGTQPAADALDVAPQSLETKSSAVMALDFPGIGAVGDDALFINDSGALGILVEGPGNVQFRIADHFYSQSLQVYTDSIYSASLSLPNGSPWREIAVPVAAGTHLVSFQGASVVIDDLRFTPAARVTTAEALDTPSRAWHTEGALVFGATGTPAAEGGDYAMLGTEWLQPARLETDLSGPAKISFLCQTNNPNCFMTMVVNGDAVLTLPGPYATGEWQPVEMVVPGQAATFGIHFQGQALVKLDRFVVTPIAANTLTDAIEWTGGPLHAAASGAAWTVENAADAAGDDALRVEFPSRQTMAEFRAEVAGPGVVRWRQKCTGAPGYRSVTVSTNAEVETTLLNPENATAWAQYSVTLPEGATWLRWNVQAPGADFSGNLPTVFFDDFKVLPVGTGLGEALNHPELTWRTSPEWPWTTAVPGVATGPAKSTGAVESWIETTVTGPGAATFILTGDRSGEFLVDGVARISAPGYGTWLHTEPLSAGAHTLRWRIEPEYRSGSIALKRFEFSPAAPPLTTILGALCQTWTTGGDGVWAPVIVDTPGTIRAAASPVLMPGQSSWLETTVTGPARIEWMPGNSYLLSYSSDAFSLEIDGVLCGPAEIMRRRAHVGPGEHRVRWIFARGYSHGFLPQAWLYSVTVIPAAAPNAPMAIHAPESVWLDTTGQTFDASLTGGPGGTTALTASAPASGTAVVTGPCRLSWQWKVSAASSLDVTLYSGSYGPFNHPAPGVWRRESIWLGPGSHPVTFSHAAGSTVWLADMQSDETDPYAIWLGNYSIYPGNDQPHQDTDTDGIPNRVEFALGLDALEHNVYPVVDVREEGDRIAFRLPLATGRSTADIVWLPQTSSDLDIWRPLNAAAGLTVVEAENTITFSAPRPALGNGVNVGFFRLRGSVPR